MLALPELLKLSSERAITMMKRRARTLTLRLKQCNPTHSLRKRAFTFPSHNTSLAAHACCPHLILIQGFEKQTAQRTHYFAKGQSNFNTIFASNGGQNYSHGHTHFGCGAKEKCNHLRHKPDKARDHIWKYIHREHH